MIEVLKQMYQLLLTEPHAPAVCDQLEPMLREAIAEWESAKPYALDKETGILLYTHPPQRTWVGLTDEEFWELDKEDLSLRQFVQAIDDRLKEKNT